MVAQQSSGKITKYYTYYGLWGFQNSIKTTKAPFITLKKGYFLIFKILIVNCVAQDSEN